MIRRIPVHQIRIGMYVHALGADQAPGCATQGILLDDIEKIRRIRESGAREVCIDTLRGADTSAVRTLQAHRKDEP